MRTAVDLRGLHDTYTVCVLVSVCKSVCVCARTFVYMCTERESIGSPRARCVYICVLLKAVLSSDRKLIVWVLVNDPQETETKSVKQVAQNKGTPLSRGHTGSHCSPPQCADRSHSSDAHQQLRNSHWIHTFFSLFFLVTSVQCDMQFLWSWMLLRVLQAVQNILKSIRCINLNFRPSVSQMLVNRSQKFIWLWYKCNLFKVVLTLDSF